MIKYRSEFYGFKSLTRMHGSAVLKATVPAVCSTAILSIALFAFSKDIDDNDETRVTLDPYPIAALISFFTFLITFRANFAYGRYWEGATAVHQMLSKWLDVGMNMAAYHYQCGQYDAIRPPSFGKHAKLRNLTREREREKKVDMDDLETKLEEALEKKKLDIMEQKKRFYERLWSLSRPDILLGAAKRKLENTTSTGATPSPTVEPKKEAAKPGHRRKQSVGKTISTRDSKYQYTANVPKRSLLGDGDASYRPSQREMSSSSHLDLVALLSEVETGQMEPSLFLQECAHLISLLSAVAMSTLRRDLDGVDPPLVEHIPGRPWPPVDPDKLGDEIRVQYHEDSKLWTAVYFLLGLTRSTRHRTLYNAARPFRVLGGVSDSEIKQLREARGPYSKVSLCSMWLQEFISREYLAGSTGDVAPPIISRVYQFASDGMIGYNQCRKIAYVPYPFAHAQIAVFFIVVILFVFPLVIYSYVNNEAYAIFLNFITVLCFVGLHEVARELEAPFENVPNDIPLNRFQAEFNEALIAMYAGFHPDSWWQITDEVKQTDLPSLEPEQSKEKVQDGENKGTKKSN